MKHMPLCLEDSADIDIKDLKKMEANLLHWEKSAHQYRSDHAVSWKDLNMIQLEIKTLLNFLHDGDFILDAGCSNGFTTFEILKTRDLSVQGIDYSQTAITEANKVKERSKMGKKAIFSHGNILNLAFNDHTFDKVMGVRVIINLPSFTLQKAAIAEIHRVLKPGGIYLMSEAFQGSLNKLNSLRRLADLPDLAAPVFNLYLEEQSIEEYLTTHFEIMEIRRFSSIYYVGSRFARYLTMQPQNIDSYDNDFNDFFKKFEETPFSGDFGIQKLYALKKK